MSSVCWQECWPLPLLILAMLLHTETKTLVSRSLATTRRPGRTAYLWLPFLRSLSQDCMSFSRGLPYWLIPRRQSCGMQGQRLTDSWRAQSGKLWRVPPPLDVPPPLLDLQQWSISHQSWRIPRPDFIGIDPHHPPPSMSSSISLKWMHSRRADATKAVGDGRVTHCGNADKMQFLIAV